MPKFRKKPVVIEAVQWFSNVHVPDVCRLESCKPFFLGPHIHTLEGPFVVSPGDWIITGVKGEKYPCKPDIFEATYERVSDNYRVAPLALDSGIAG